MQLKLIHDFELEVGEKMYSGTLRDLTKKEVKQIEKLSPTKELKQLKKLEREEGDIDEINRLIDIVEGYDTEKVYKARLDMSLEGKHKDDILQVGEVYGYSRVYQTIIEDIAERKEGN